MLKIICGIYTITSPSGRVYIGQSRDIIKRFYRHKSLGEKTKRHPFLFNSLSKYGIENHKFITLHELPNDIDKNILDKYEQIYMDFYRDCGISLLNCREAGSRGTLCEESRKKISVKLTGKSPSQETKDKISAKLKISGGHPIDSETRKKISKTLTGRKPPKEEIEKASKAIKEGYDNGTRKKIQGEDHYFCKLSWEQICEIRNRCVLGERQCDIAKEFNLDPGYVSQLISFRYRKTK